MTSVAQITLAEWQASLPAAGSPLLGRTLAGPRERDLATRLARLKMLEVAELRAGLAVRSFSHVGTVRLGDLTVTVVPKLNRVSLLNLLRYAYGFRKLNLLPEAAQFLDRALYTEIAYYNYLYQGLQVGANQIDPITLIPASRTRNAGGARVYGIDFSAAYLPPSIDGLRLSGAILWNHARFKTFNGIPCWGGQTIADGCIQVFNTATGRFTAQSMTGQACLSQLAHTLAGPSDKVIGTAHYSSVA